MKSTPKTITLLMCLCLAALALEALYSLPDAQATTSAPDYAIVLPGDQQAAPLAGRPAPYGQLLITHNGVSITTTEQLGTVARTNGYDDLKAIMCSAGAYDVDVNLYGRVSSSGSVYTITTGVTTVPANSTHIITVTEISPWMSLGLTSEVTGSTTTCGIYVQTP